MGLWDLLSNLWESTKFICIFASKYVVNYGRD